jgi:hypothetical protein
LEPGGRSGADEVTSFLLQSRESLFDMVREDVDNAAIFISCPVEWIKARCGDGVWDGDNGFVQRAQLLYHRFAGVPFSLELARTRELADFMGAVRDHAPSAFSQWWTPLSIVLYVLYYHQLRFGNVDPDQVLAAVSAVESSVGKNPARMLGFLLGVRMGAAGAHQIERFSCPEKFAVANITQGAGQAGGQSARSSALEPSSEIFREPLCPPVIGS